MLRLGYQGVDVPPSYEGDPGMAFTNIAGTNSSLLTLKCVDKNLVGDGYSSAGATFEVQSDVLEPCKDDLLTYDDLSVPLAGGILNLLDEADKLT